MRGQLMRVREYDGSTWNASTTNAYNLLGNLTGVTDGNGNITVMGYDNFGRLWRICTAPHDNSRCQAANKDLSVPA